MTDLTPDRTMDLELVWASLHTELLAHRRTVRSDQHVVRTTPVTLLTGFLGAGKSTLLAGLLTTPPADMTIRAVVNDVGSLPFDPSLLVDGTDLDIELSNGCGCCSSSVDLAETLDRMATTGPDLLVLEASGVADPFALAQVVEAEPALELDRIVTVLDAIAFEAQLQHPTLGPLVRRQLSAAHAVVLSRADQCSELDRLTGLVAELAPGTVIKPSEPTRLALDALTPQLARGTQIAESTASARGGTDHGLVSRTFVQRGPLDRVWFERTMETTKIIRLKGWLTVDGAPFLVQFATDQWSWIPARSDVGASSELGQVLVVLETDRDADDLSSLLEGVDLVGN